MGDQREIICAQGSGVCLCPDCAKRRTEMVSQGDMMPGFSDDSLARRLLWVARERLESNEQSAWLEAAARRLSQRDCPGFGHVLAAIDTLESARTILDHDEDGESAALPNVRNALYHLRQVVGDVDQ